MAGDSARSHNVRGSLQGLRGQALIMHRIRELDADQNALDLRSHVGRGRGAERVDEGFLADLAERIALGADMPAVGECSQRSKCQ